MSCNGFFQLGIIKLKKIQNNIIFNIFHALLNNLIQTKLTSQSFAIISSIHNTMILIDTLNENALQYTFMSNV